MGPRFQGKVLDEYRDFWLPTGPTQALVTI